MTEQDHEFNFDVIDQWSETVEFPVEKDRLIAYAEATNDEFEPHTSGTYGSPIFAIVPVTTIMAETTLGAVPDELMMRILHGEQDMRFIRPIRPGDQLICKSKVVGIHGRSSGVVVTTLTETRTTDGELVNEQYFTGFFRGGQLDGGKGEEPPAHGFDGTLRTRQPAASIVQNFDADQTFRYAEASGDMMPIHTDDNFAKEMGLPGIIIHGLCTMAFTSRAVIGHACPEDPSRLKRLVVRFSAPAQPKHRLTTEIWDLPEIADGDTLSFAFETSTDEGTYVIKDGLAEISA